jgi:thioredoxin reductase (NADPH)
MSIAETRRDQIFPRLSEAQLAVVGRHGKRRSIRAGETLFAEGDRHIGSFFVLSGGIEIFRRDSLGGKHRITIHGPGEFTGEVSSLAGRASVANARAVEDSEVLSVDETALRNLVVAHADLSELIMRAFILRRVALIQDGAGSVTLVGSRHSADTLRLSEFLTRNGQPFAYLDVDADKDTGVLLERFGVGVSEVPVVVCRGTIVLKNPTNRELADCIGLGPELTAGRVYDVAVVGAGPGGLAAAVYAASEGLNVVVLDAKAPGGQAGSSSKIENYLGFPTGISGQALAGRAFVQAQKFGAELALPREAVGFECGADSVPVVKLDSGEVLRSRSVVIASGARYRKPALQDFIRFEGRGVYYGASFIEARLCREQEVIVIGGGNSAGQAAVFLAGHARHVHILVRGPGLADTMSRYLIQRIETAPNITLHAGTEIVALAGEGDLERVRWHHKPTGAMEEHAIAHVFVFIGADPNSGWLSDCVTLDQKSFVKTGIDLSQDELRAAGWGLHRSPFLLETSLPGVFAVGDVRSGSVKRVAAAVGEGAAAVQMIHQVLALGDASAAGLAGAAAAVVK